MQNVDKTNDMDAKRQLHELADERNVIGTRWGRSVLLCGAIKHSKSDGYCKALAGFRTNHPGYGRCRYCGGSSTGPKTDEGKSVVSQNSRKHGFYSPALFGQERVTYEKLRHKQEISLNDEIFMWKAKLLTYLQKWEKIRQEEGEKATRIWFKDGQERAYYYAGTAEDRVVSRNLETIGRLVEKHARLNPDQGEDLLGQINAELRAASQDKVSISWGGAPQQRINPVNTGVNSHEDAGK